MARVHASRTTRTGLALAAAALLVTSAPLPGAVPSGNDPLVSVLVREVAPATSAAERAVAAVGGSVRSQLGIVGGFAADVPAAGIEALRALPGVVTDVVQAAPVRFDGAYGQNSGAASAVYPQAVQADDVWREGNTGQGIGVAIIDTGVNGTGDLAGRVVHSEDFSGEGDGVDRFGHGTFVAGLIAGSGAASNGAVKGVAPGVDIINLKIAGRNGAADITRVMAALQWAVSFKDVYNIKVINLSLGTDSTQDYRIDPLNLAVERAWQAGITVVVAASNRGPNAGTISKPADDPYVITVGSSNDNSTPRIDDDTVPDFSGAGPTAANGLSKPDVAAPGGSLVSLRVPGSSIDEGNGSARVGTSYFKGSGTSFSSAVTAGTAALVLARNPSLTPDQVKARIVDTARTGPVTDRQRVGSGWLDARAATQSNSTASANQGLEPSTGTGSLELSRGSLETGIVTDLVTETVTSPLGVVSTVNRPVVTPLTGDLTAQNKVFDAREFRTTEWTGSSWYDSQWSGSSWYGSSWYGSSWYGSSWYGSSWYGSSWYGSSWYGSSWYGSSWYGSSWYGSSWYSGGWV